MRVYKSFSVAGIAYYEALFVINQMKVGEKVDLKPEDNIYDENAWRSIMRVKSLAIFPEAPTTPYLQFYAQGGIYLMHMCKE